MKKGSTEMKKGSTEMKKRDYEMKKGSCGSSDINLVEGHAEAVMVLLGMVSSCDSRRWYAAFRPQVLLRAQCGVKPLRRGNKRKRSQLSLSAGIAS